MIQTSVKVKKTSKMSAYQKIQELNWANEVQAQAEKTLSRARMLAPVLSGSLKSNGTTEKIKGGVRVKFGDSRVPYARRRHFENRKNPHTKQYLSRAGDTVKKEGFVVLKEEKR